MQSPIIPFPQRRGQLRREIAHLVCVRQKTRSGFADSIDLPSAMREAVGRVLREQIVLDEEHFVELIAGEFVGERRDAFADDDGRKRSFGLLGDLLRGGQSLEADFVPLAFALLGDEKNFHGSTHSTRASWRSFSISFAATSFGEPVMNSVFLVFCGT